LVAALFDRFQVLAIAGVKSSFAITKNGSRVIEVLLFSDVMAIPAVRAGPLDLF
jgi:hypothetical protein